MIIQKRLVRALGGLISLLWENKSFKLHNILLSWHYWVETIMYGDRNVPLFFSDGKKIKKYGKTFSKWNNKPVPRPSVQLL